jgi:hypothetical protein
MLRILSRSRPAAALARSDAGQADAGPSPGPGAVEHRRSV